jgi:hypothetical protein
MAANQRYLAIRGAEPDDAGDINADYILAQGFRSQLNPQFIGLQGAVQDWIDDGTLSPGFSITGHSLGGYLAVGLGTSFDEAGAVYTFNAPGFGGDSGDIADAIRDVFGLGDTPLVSDVTNIRGTAGISLIAGLGQQPAPPTFIETESKANPFDNHSIVGLADALAVHALYGELDPSLEASGVMDIVKASRRNNEVSLEGALDALREIVLGGDTASTPEGNREEFYDNCFALKDSARYTALVGNADIDVLTGDSSASLAQSARSDAALRYALDHGHVMVLRADLPVYREESNAPENFSDQYLLDRARYVANVVEGTGDAAGGILLKASSSTKIPGGSWESIPARRARGCSSGGRRMTTSCISRTRLVRRGPSTAAPTTCSGARVRMFFSSMLIGKARPTMHRLLQDQG